MNQEWQFIVQALLNGDCVCKYHPWQIHYVANVLKYAFLQMLALFLISSQTLSKNEPPVFIK